MSELMPFMAVVLSLVAGDWPKADTFDGTNPSQRLDVVVEPHGYSMRWADTEDTLGGTITPQHLVAGEPFTVSLAVGVIDGASFIGPVTMSLRKTGSVGEQQSQTVSRGAGKTWNATFTPPEGGEFVLEIAWRTTTLKQTRGIVTVEAAPMAAWIGKLLAAMVILAAISLGVWQVFRKPAARASDTP